MAKHGVLLSYHSFSVLIITLSLLCRATCYDRKVYIVYLGSLLSDELCSLSSHHLSILQKVVEDSSPENVLVRSYKRSLNGFAARLTDQEREKLSNMKEVAPVFPSRTLQLQTTRSWDFMGFSEKIGRNSTVESDIIVGVIDSGIWPESDSFKDKPPPKKWKGACEGGKNFTCHNKLIGARYYSSTESARDDTGHGTHTASTAAGNAIRDVSFYGLAQASVAFSMIQEFDVDPLAIGTFHAMGKGILTSHAAGNNGPSGATVSSVAPWVLTVAASSMDRRIIDKVVLGNGTTAIGNSVNSFTLNGTSFPLIHGKDASRNCTETEARDPRVNILKSEVIKNAAAPAVASFSARGSNLILPDIIKPDISAPGIEILAAFSSAPISTTPGDMRRVNYNVQSGTSMSCPHAAGVAAYVKTFHPDWSPAAIKSSIRTTAWPMNDPSSNVATGEFTYGSGHINPLKAIDPGLVYDASKEDYIKLMCISYDESRVRLVSGGNSTCPTGPDKGSPKDHNYPSMGAKVTAMQPFTVTFNRRVKNVGIANSTYLAKISPSSKLEIKVVPEVLSFKSLNEEKTFNVTVSGTNLPFESRASASLVWSDGTHSVRSPIVVYTVPRT
ncbi:hypothetical protein ACLB2K_031129 [Fragaria x ananassa]